MRCKLAVLGLAMMAMPAQAQRLLTLEECRHLALTQSKELSITKEKALVAQSTRRAAYTSYLPELTLKAGYIYNPNPIQLLSEEQKARLGQLGTGLTSAMGSNPALAQAVATIAAKHPDMLPLVNSLSGALTPMLAQSLNQVGGSLVEALQPETKHIYGGVLTLTQPLYVGGKIRAYNTMARLGESLANEQVHAKEQELILSTEQAYWQVVSLVAKKRLALSYVELLGRLSGDVDKMIAEGVATKSDGLNIAVRLNEAEIALAKVEDGLGLARMLLCQVVGLPLEAEIRLQDESLEELPVAELRPTLELADVLERRTEVKSLRLLEGIARERIRLVRSEQLPTLALRANYMLTNPNLNNGLQNTIGARWNVGLVLQAPIWNWGRGLHKVRAAKSEARIANYNVELAKERIELQVSQATNKYRDAYKHLAMTLKNMERAEENRKSAELGFREGLMPTSRVLEAQAAWLSAHSAKIDAQIDCRLAEMMWRRATASL